MTSIGERTEPPRADSPADPVRNESTPPTRSPWRMVGAIAIVAAGFLLVAAAYALSLQSNNPTTSDFIGYWVAGQQLAHHANPYDTQAIFQLEKRVGYDGLEPRLTPSPPVAVILLLPLGYLSVKLGLFLWTMIQFACLSLSLWLLWLRHGRPSTILHLFGFAFAPAIACLQAGQLGLFFLFALVLFLYFIETMPFLAGVFLLPCALKPHLFVPFGIALILWAMSKKSYRVLAGAGSIAVASSALTWLFDPQVWTHYFAMARSASLEDRYTPTLSVVFRQLVAWNAEWPRFVLLAVGCIWAVWYFWTRRDRWDWMDQGQTVLLASVVCSPYAWFTDESLLLPAVLTGVLRARQTHQSLVPFALASGVALAEIACAVKITTLFYIWTAPAWLACFVLATTQTNRDRQSRTASSAAPGNQ